MLRDSYLIQRLRSKPIEGSIAHRVFGGGMLGLSDQTWNVLDQVCTVDYMGASEYEFGELPKALSQIYNFAREGKLTTFTFTLAPHERVLNHIRKWNRKVRHPAAKTVRIFGICHTDLVDEVQERIRGLAASPEEFYIKRGTHMEDALDPIGEASSYRGPVQGWVELNNAFMFFSSEDMWRGFCTIFGVEPCTFDPHVEAIDYSKMTREPLIKALIQLGVLVNVTEGRKLKKDELLALVPAPE